MVNRPAISSLISTGQKPPTWYLKGDSEPTKWRGYGGIMMESPKNAEETITRDVPDGDCVWATALYHLNQRTATALLDSTCPVTAWGELACRPRRPDTRDVRTVICLVPRSDGSKLARHLKDGGDLLSKKGSVRHAKRPLESWDAGTPNVLLCGDLQLFLVHSPGSSGSAGGGPTPGNDPDAHPIGATARIKKHHFLLDLWQRPPHDENTVKLANR
ncbi:hypothetical protein VTK73DRAFT_9223 [Phialemonium thermophilum]|uniref:Uncharacterized protein n=1 Tax=Phialemonium thermophilum TaxID=223376 RepID=A0ABR3W3W0_9PEZI